MSASYREDRWRDNNNTGLSLLSCHQTFFTASSKVRKPPVVNATQQVTPWFGELNDMMSQKLT